MRFYFCSLSLVNVYEMQITTINSEFLLIEFLLLPQKYHNQHLIDVDSSII
jgi:hypothetical protein